MPRATNSTPDSDVLVDNTRRDVLIFTNPPPIPDHPEVFGGWYNDTPWRAPGETGFFYNDSLSSVQSPGGNVEFHFKGTQIAVFGSVIPFAANLPPAVSWYSVNGADFTKYTAPNVSDTANGVNFYTSPALPLAEHVLTINVTTANEGSDYYLDWIEYNVSARDGGASSVSSGSQSSTALPGSSASAAETSSSSAPPTSAPAENAVRTKAAPVGAIAGGVVGGVVLILCAVLALLAWRRRKRLIANIPKDYDYGPRGRPDTIPAVIAYDGQPLMGADSGSGSRPSTPSTSPSMVERHPKLLAASAPAPLPAPVVTPPPTSSSPPSLSGSGPVPTAPAPAPARPRKGGKKGASTPTSDVSGGATSAPPPPDAAAGGQPPVNHHRAMMDAEPDPMFEEDAATDLPPAYVAWS
ncbi:hypothetical protein C2E23DRAFT_889287 [Lenzites betulinus]|nr:hypothetical protein C2E23DRAFT_889287 [Lenzites betulinus]